MHCVKFVVSFLGGLCLLALLPLAAQAQSSSTMTVVGAAASPPTGPGPGQLFSVEPGTGKIQVTRFAKSATSLGNSFYVGYDPTTHEIYIPSPAGRVTIVALPDHIVAHFPVIRGARVARVVPSTHLVLVLSGKELAAYDMKTHGLVFILPVGGNAIAVDSVSDHAFVGGNMDKVVTEVALPSGQVLHKYEVAGSGDLKFAHGHVYSADIETGVLSVLDPHTGSIQRITTPEVDPHFSYKHIPEATAGFMQLAVGPGGNTLYAAGFSGHILEFSAYYGTYVGEIRIAAGPGPAHLSGLAIVDHGDDALVTVENRDETVMAALSNGKVLSRFPRVSSNRWVAISKR